MKLLLDENLSHRLRSLIVGHDVFSVKFLGWRGTRNGALIARAAAEGFDAIITFDSGIEYEQNLSALPCFGRRNQCIGASRAARAEVVSGTGTTASTFLYQDYLT